MRKLDREADWALMSNPAGAAEVAGLLLGNADSIIEVSDYEPVLLMRQQDHAYALTGPGSLEFKRVMAAVRTLDEGGRAVGYYRSHIGETAEFEEEDLRLVRSCFGNTPAVMLLRNRTAAGVSRARLFVGDENGRFSELCLEEDTSPEIDASQHELDQVTKAMEVPGASVTESRQIKRIFPALQQRWFRYASLWVAQILAAVLMGYMILKGSWKSKDSEVVTSPGTEATTNGSSHGDLMLQVERQGERLRLNWDRRSPVMSGAKGGELTIRDGNMPGRDVLLDGDFLRTGSVLYRPLEGHVVFRLAVFDAVRGDIVDSVEVGK